MEKPIFAQLQDVQVELGSLGRLQIGRLGMIVDHELLFSVLDSDLAVFLTAVGADNHFCHRRRDRIWLLTEDNNVARHREGSAL